MRVTPAVRRAGLAVLLGVAVTTCRDDPTGPGRGSRASLALAPVFPAAVANLAAFGLAIDSLRIVVIRPQADTVADTTVGFAADQDSLALALSIPLNQSPETFTIVMELRGGGFVLFTGSTPADVSAGSNAPIEITNFVYSGPGAGVTTLTVTPVDSVIRFGDSLRFQVDAQAGGVPVTQFYVSWSSSNATLAPINAHGVMHAPAQRALVQVTATTPTGITATVPVTFVPVPTSVASVPPLPQNVPALAPIGPLRVRVLAGDGLGVKGVPVTFAAVSGGGSVLSLVVATDSAGFAETNAISGPTGTSVYSATVAGLTPVTFNVIVVGQVGTHLAFSFPPTGAIADQPFGLVVEVRDSQGAVVAAATDPITIGLGANPGSAVLGGTLTVNAVQGLAVFGDLTIDSVGSGYTLVATAPALTSATTPPFDVIAAFTGRLWTNPLGGNWSDPANWSDSIVPVAGDTVYVAVDGDYTVTLDVNVSVGMLFFGGASGTQTLSGLSRTLQVDGVLSIGATGVVSLVNSTITGDSSTVFNTGALQIQASTVAGSLLNYPGAQVVARGNSALGGDLLNSNGATTRIEGDPFCCTGTLTIGGGLSNSGLIELTSINPGGTTATLAVLGTDAVNLVDGVIAALPGTGGSRVINGQLINHGLIQIDQDVTLSHPGASHQNLGSIVLNGGSFTLNQSGTLPSFESPGTIVIGAGRIFAVNGGAFTYDSPAPGGLGGLGAFNFQNATLDLIQSLANDSLGLSLVSATVNGPGTLTNALGRTLTVEQTAINAPFENFGTFVARGASSLGNTVVAPASSIIRIQADPACCTGALTVVSGFTNDGLIELTAVGVGGTTATLAVTSGTLVNGTGATIAALPGTGGARVLQAQLSNDGTLLVAQDLTLNKVEADHLNSGLIQLTTGNLTLAQSGSTPTFTTPGSIVVGAGRTLAVSGGTFQYTSAAPGGLAGLGVLDFQATTLGLVQAFTADTLSASFVNATVNGPGTLATAAGRTLTMQQTAINAPFVNGGTLVSRGASSINGGLTTSTGSTIQLQADPQCCTSTLTVPGGFTNNGLLELTAINVGGTTATLDVPSGFLVNAPAGTIAARAGTGGVRNLQLALNNQGTLLVEADVSLAGGSADHVNTGQILVTGGILIVPQSGTTPTFTTSGSLVVSAGRALQLSGGAFSYSSGVLGGLGSFTFFGAVVNLTPPLANDTLSLAFTNSTVSGPGTLTNAVGRSLTIEQTALNAPFVNQGMLIARGASSLGASVTAAAGGTIRVEADPACCTAVLSVTNPFTNHGLIELTAVNTGGTNASLDVAGGLTNGTDGTIALVPGTGGARTLATALTNNGLITLATDATIGTANASYVNTGTIDVLGGNLTLPLTGTTPVFTNQGTIAVAAGRTVSVTGGAAGSFTNAGTGTLAGTGTFDVSSTSFTNDGTVAPGGSPGALTFIGSYSMGASAVLGIEIGGTVAGTDYDQVVVGGTGSLAGTLNVTLINGFTPTIGQVFTVVSGGSIVGLPTSLNLPSVAGAIWLPTLGAAGLQLSIVSASALIPVTWTGGGGDGLWGTGANWSTLAPPGAGDSAIINPVGPVTVTINTTATAAFLDIGTLVGAGTKTLALTSPTLTLTAGGIVGGDGVVNLNGGTLTGGGTLQVNGAFNWTGGQLAGAGVVQISPAGALTLSGTGTKNLNSRTIQTGGPVTWSGTGAIGSGGGALLRVQTGGTLAVNGDASFLHNLGGSPPRVIVEPGGALVRSSGTGIANVAVQVDNAGGVQVNTGTLELRGGGVHAGSFAIGTGALLDFPQGTHTFAGGSQFTGAGLARVTGGTLSVDPAVSVPVNRLHLLSGSVLGDGELAVIVL